MHYSTIQKQKVKEQYAKYNVLKKFNINLTAQIFWMPCTPSLGTNAQFTSMKSFI